MRNRLILGAIALMTLNACTPVGVGVAATKGAVKATGAVAQTTAKAVF